MLLIFILINEVTIKLFNIKLEIYFIDSIRLLLKQSANYFKTIKAISNNYHDKSKMNEYLSSIKMTVLLIWILMTTALSLCISSILLLTYLRTKTFNVADSIEDILGNNALQVIGNFSGTYLSKILSQENYQILSEKLFDFENKMNMSDKSSNPNSQFAYQPQILKQIFKGETVALVHSIQSNHVKISYSYLNLVIANKKYFPTTLAVTIAKGYLHHDQFVRA